MLTFALFVGVSMAIGYALPPRWAPWTIASMTAIIAASWLLYDGSFHNDPWPFLITPGGVALAIGALMRLAQRRLSGGA